MIDLFSNSQEWVELGLYGLISSCLIFVVGFAPKVSYVHNQSCLDVSHYFYMFLDELTCFVRKIIEIYVSLVLEYLWQANISGNVICEEYKGVISW